MIQREIEGVGIPTIGISILRKYAEKIKPPRTIYLRWPFGHPLGEPFDLAQQRAVLIEVFKALYSIDKPGQIINIPFKWKKHRYDKSSIEELKKL